MGRSFRRDIGALAQVFDLVDAFTRSAGLLPSDAFPFRLAIEEVFVNMVKHNPLGDGDIGITLERDGDRLTAILRDPDAREYDITKHRVASLDAPIQDRSPGGLGVHLVRSLMDEVRYSFQGREARITLVKHIPTSHASDRRQ